MTFDRLTDFVPPGSAEYCRELHQKYNFEFHVARPRRTRLGDFTYRPGVPPAITVNVNLNPYAFLITYLHEVAHCAVYRRYRKKVAPHGPEWKSAFREILVPVMHSAIFPADVLAALKAYAVNPKATTSGDVRLSEALKKYDPDVLPDNKKTLKHLKEGSLFVFNGRGFIKGPLRRTRVLCTETSSQRKYTISAHALVEEQD